MRLKTAQRTYPVGISLEGDTVKAGLWVVWARNKLSALLNMADGGVRSKVYEPEPDVHIEINASTNTAFIRIVAGGTVFLETGFYDHLSLAPLNERTYRASYLHYAAEQQTDYARVSPAQDRLTLVQGWVDGQKKGERDSKAILGGEKLTKISPNGFTSATAVYGSDKTLAGKTAQAAIKPSNYSGLMQLYVQVLYGKLPRQYDLQINPFSPPNLLLKISDKEFAVLPFQGVASTWLYCNGQWDYWLVNIESYSTVVLRKLNCSLPKPSVSPVTAINIRQTHAAMLASSKPSSKTTRFALGQTILGEPLAYGWKADNTNTTAHMVCHTEVDGNIRRTAYHYVLTIQTDKDHKPNGASLGLVETADWDVSWGGGGSHALWIPDYYSMEQAPLYRMDKSATNIACDAPLYVTSSGVVRITGATSGGMGFAGGGVFATGTHSTTGGYDSGNVVSFSGTVSDSDYFHGVNLNGPGEYYGADGSAPLDSWPPPYEFTYYQVDKTSYDTSRITDRESWDGQSQSFTAALLIPFGDCDAVLYGKTAGLYTTNHYKRHIDRPGSVFRITWLWLVQVGTNPDGSPITEMQSSGQETNFRHGAYYWSVCPWQGPWNTDQTIYNHVDTSDVLEQSMGLYINGQNLDFEYSLTYFTPELGPTGNPNINGFNVQASLGGSYTVSGSLGESANADWPAHTSNPCGWA
jgi:hypothetical protein